MKNLHGFLELHGNQIGIFSNTNLNSNKYERDMINISKNNLLKIIGNDIEKIFITKNLYINGLVYTMNFTFTKEEFLKLKVLNGKTKKYFRIKLNKTGIYTTNKIKNELEIFEREVA